MLPVIEGGGFNAKGNCKWEQIEAHKMGYEQS